MRWPWLVLLVACGRYGFDEQEAGPGNQVVIPVGIDRDAVPQCAQAAPFLALIDVVAFGNPNTQTVRYCYLGLSGSLTAQMLREGGELFVESTGPIEPAMIDLFIGGSNCFGCFIRLVADGVTFDGPISDFSGD